jgi:hypothetical protein
MFHVPQAYRKVNDVFLSYISPTDEQTGRNYLSIMHSDHKNQWSIRRRCGVLVKNCCCQGLSRTVVTRTGKCHDGPKYMSGGPGGCTSVDYTRIFPETFLVVWRHSLNLLFIVLNIKILLQSSRTPPIWHSKGKAVPLQATDAFGGTVGIAPTHSRPRHSMGLSGQRHATAALYPRGKDPQYPLYRRLGGPQSWSGHRD